MVGRFCVGAYTTCQTRKEVRVMLLLFWLHSIVFSVIIGAWLLLGGGVSLPSLILP